MYTRLLSISTYISRIHANFFFSQFLTLFFLNSVNFFFFPKKTLHCTHYLTIFIYLNSTNFLKTFNDQIMGIWPRCTITKSYTIIRHTRVIQNPSCYSDLYLFSFHPFHLKTEDVK